MAIYSLKCDYHLVYEIAVSIARKLEILKDQTKKNDTMMTPI